MTVFICGAGPTGLALACGLLQRGIDVRLVDAAAEPATTSRALAVQPRGAEVLDRLDALGDLPQRSITTMGLTFHEGARDLLTVRMGESPVAGSSQSILLVSQAEVEGQLRQRLSELGGTVEWGVTLTDAVPSADGVTVTLDNATSTRADWLVGCDGAHSTVRKLGGFAFPGEAIIERFGLADVRAHLPIGRDGTHAWAHRDGLLIAFPLPGDNLWRLIAPLSSDDTDVLAELHRRMTELLSSAIEFDKVEWASVFRIQRRLADHYRSGRLLLAGDAAHINSPFGGQGMNTGFGDAENLAWKLVLVAKGLAVEQLLDTYETERRPVANEVGAGTTLLTRMMLGGNALIRTFRDRVALPLARQSFIQSRVRAAGSQLGVSYRGGPLASSGRRRGLPTAIISDLAAAHSGDRVPDVKCRLADGETAQLHRALGGRWAMLVPDGSPTPALQRLGGEVITLVADVPEPMLVRPDAHLAWRASRASMGLDGYLDRVSLHR
ncbi:FAD-dependent monooxygenase [Nocardia sp. NPDC020380]|uniref:FAD-dependent monooxygenase n=1 Tax=Nocardia sp. NPDC020380 TaxID=3364309 RepID=UPI0037A60249